jgi:hypothetical protein
MTYKELSAKVKKAFASLRPLGYFCRSNFWCCQSCAWSDIPPDKKNKVVFWHNQDTEGAKDNEKKGKTPYLYLAWAAPDAKEIVQALRDQGLVVMYQDKDKRILVF